jgi:RNA polymerase sigma factor (sigma-70 family)
MILRAQRGDRDAIAEMVRLWQPRLWRMALAKLGDEEAAWDTTQDAWLSILRGFPRLRRPETFGGWAMKIVANASANRLRRDRRLSGVIQALKDKARRTSSPSDSHLDYQLLSTLPEPQFQVLIMYYWERMSVSQIAETLDVPGGTVKSRLYHARLHFKQLLGDNP